LLHYEISVHRKKMLRKIFRKIDFVFVLSITSLTSLVIMKDDDELTNK